MAYLALIVQQQRLRKVNVSLMVLQEGVNGKISVLERELVVEQGANGYDQPGCGLFGQLGCLGRKQKEILERQAQFEEVHQPSSEQ
mgnify:CR=1 FL=1